MKLPNWFKILWWIILLLLTGVPLYFRFQAIITGETRVGDLLLMIIFIALMLVPIFAEIELFGIKLKKDIEAIKNDINLKFVEIKSEIRNSQTQTFNANIHGFGPPPPDTKLPELEKQINDLVNAKLNELGIRIDTPLASRVDVPQDNLLLFQIRFNIEKQLRRIWENRFKNSPVSEFSNSKSMMNIIRDLINYEIIEPSFFEILKEVISICNYAIHGNFVTEKQTLFVTKNAKQVLDYLSEIK